MRNATLFHDGCGICLGIADTFSGLFDSALVLFEAIDLSKHADRIADAEKAGVSVLPSLVIDGRVLPIDQHSDLDNVRPC